MADSCFMELVKKRKSERNYDSKLGISDNSIELMVEAARLAPSASNRQPWHFIAVKDDIVHRQICTKALGGIVANKFASNAPVIFVLCTETGFSAVKAGEIVKRIPYHLIDAGIAGEHLVLQAAELGIGTCWIGWFKESRIKEILKIPKGIKVVSLITAGYPKSEIAESLRTGAEKPYKKGEASGKGYQGKKRKTLSSILHWDKW